MIKNLTPSLPEVGKIKIGFKGAEITSKQGKKFQPPNKLDHFIITGLERGPDGNFLINKEIHSKVGEKPKELDVRLLYDDPNLNFLTRYACYSGTKLWCTGDGEAASRLTGENGNRQTVKCPCEHLDSDYKSGPKCKPSGVLSVMLDESPIVGGVWKLRTTSFNSVTNILSSMAMISRITGGVLAGIPLKLTFGKKTTKVPGTEQQTTIPIIGLVYKGSVRELAESGQKTALEFAGYRKRIEYIEDIARKQLDKEMGLGIYTEAETDEDIVAEFYPEQVVAGSQADKKPEAVDTKPFDELVNKHIVNDSDLPMIEKFVAMSAKALGKTPDEVKVMAVENFNDFLNQFNGWLAKQKEPKSAAPADKGGSGNPPEPVKETATSQGPPPEKPKASGEWDPVTADYMERYKGDKPRILIEACKKAGIEYAGKTPREMHQALKESVKPDQTAQESDKPVTPTDLFDGLDPEEKLARCKKIHARIKTIAPALIDQAAQETGMSWAEVGADADMAAEFVLYCLACYKGDVKTLMPNGN